MKVFVLLFCLIVAISALPAGVDNIVEIESDGLAIDDQNEDLVGAETAHRGGYGHGGGYGGYRGGGRGHGGYGRGYGGGRGHGGGHHGHGGWHGK